MAKMQIQPNDNANTRYKKKKKGGKEKRREKRGSIFSYQKTFQ